MTTTPKIIGYTYANFKTKKFWDGSGFNSDVPVKGCCFGDLNSLYHYPSETYLGYRGTARQSMGARYNDLRVNGSSYTIYEGCT